MKRLNDTGRQPKSAALRIGMAKMVPPKYENETIVVHHYTDRKDSIQLEVERRTPQGMFFERIIL